MYSELHEIADAMSPPKFANSTEAREWVRGQLLECESQQIIDTVAEILMLNQKAS